MLQGRNCSRFTSNWFCTFFPTVTAPPAATLGPGVSVPLPPSPPSKWTCIALWVVLPDSSFFPCTVMPCIERYCHSLYVTFHFFFFYIVIFLVICNFLERLYHVTFFFSSDEFLRFLAKSGRGEEAALFPRRQKDCRYCFNIILSRHLNTRRVIIII